MSKGSRKSRSDEPREKLTYLHQFVSKEIKDGKVVVHEESVIHGPKGLSFKYYYKDESTKEKVNGRQNQDGTFTLIRTVGDQQDIKTLTKEELLKEIGKMKYLKFAYDYLKSQAGGKRSKKRSRKSSKKRSRK
jgi:hypothetical protein